MTKKAEYLLIFSTCPDSISAKKIAHDLVEEQLAVCINIIPGLESFFLWLGEVDKANELLLVIKTTSNKYAPLEKRLKKLHPYELPEIIVVPILTGSAEYLNWINTNIGES